MHSVFLTQPSLRNRKLHQTSESERMRRHMLKQWAVTQVIMYLNQRTAIRPTVWRSHVVFDVIVRVNWAYLQYFRNFHLRLANVSFQLLVDLQPTVNDQLPFLDVSVTNFFDILLEYMLTTSPSTTSSRSCLLPRVNECHDSCCCCIT